MKLLVCDVEGTIFKAKYKIEGTDFASTMWQPLAHKLGIAATSAELLTHRKWENNEYSNYIEWIEDTVEIHKFHKLHKDVFNSLIAEAEYNDGVVEFFHKLDRKKYIPVLVSGGFQELVRRAQTELNIKYGYGACEYYFDTNTGYLSSHTMTPCDFEGKHQYVSALFTVYNLNPNKDWIFIGDGKNDIHIASKAPLSYGINSHPELEKIVDFNAKCFNELYSQLIQDEDISILDETDFVYDEETNSIALKEEDWKNIISELENSKKMLAAKETEVNEVNDILTLASSENQEKEAKISELETRYTILQKERAELQQIQLAAEKRAEKEERARRKKIKDFWALHFRNFSFSETFLHEAARLPHADRMKLEEKLIQLHEAPDPQKLSECTLKQTSNEHVRFHLSDGVRARIDFRILNDQQHKVEIVELYKRKDFDRVIKNSR